MIHLFHSGPKNEQQNMQKKKNGCYLDIGLLAEVMKSLD
ncbi:hypothetical protein WP3S18E02_29020 [Aeromonas caviae]|nr:hypothetical protein WP3S18E02_29020 [Aeromonas caviae]